MQQRLWMSGQYFECAVDRIERHSGEWIVKTLGRRYFRFDGASIGLLRHVMALEALDPDDPAHQNIAAFVNVRLIPLGIYRPGDGSRATAAGAAPASHGLMRWQRQLLSARRVGQLVGTLSRLCSPWLLLPLLALCVCVHAGYVAQSLQRITYRDLVSFSPVDLLLLIAFAVVRGLLHELGHAVACWRLTRSVGAIGFGVFIATPVLYCDVSDVHLLARRQKAVVGLGGTAMDVVVLAVLISLAGAAPVVMKIYWLNLLAVVLNLVPFYRNDGYWVVNDLAGSKDLLRESARACAAGTARAGDWAWVVFTTLCTLVVAALAGEFALRVGPGQLADALHLLPAFTGATLLLVTLLQYAAVAFGAMAGAKMLVRGVRSRAPAWRGATAGGAARPSTTVNP